MPGLATLREYHLSWLRHDIIAGIVLTTMLVPVCIAYAVASGLPGRDWRDDLHRQPQQRRASLKQWTEEAQRIFDQAFPERSHSPA